MESIQLASPAPSRLKVLWDLGAEAPRPTKFARGLLSTFLAFAILTTVLKLVSIGGYIGGFAQELQEATYQLQGSFLFSGFFVAVYLRSNNVVWLFATLLSLLFHFLTIAFMALGSVPAIRGEFIPGDNTAPFLEQIAPGLPYAFWLVCLWWAIPAIPESAANSSEVTSS